MSANGQVVVAGGSTSAGLNASDGALLWTDESIEYVNDIVPAGAVTLLAGKTFDVVGVTMARVPETGSTVWTVHSENVPRIVLVAPQSARFYAVGLAPGGVFAEAYTM